MNRVFILFAVIMALLVPKTFAQTDGALMFTFNQPIPTDPSGTKNVIAVWIEDNTGDFVKTKMRYWGSGTTDHLPTWKSKSAENVVDASTGATRTSSSDPTAFGTKTVLWDGQDVNSVLVADGTYKVWVESSWQTGLSSNTHNTIISFTFTKGSDAVHLTPAGDTYFNTISIDWVPTANSVENFSSAHTFEIYPNPTNQFINIDLSKIKDNSKISIYNIAGKNVYEAEINNANGIKTIDMKNYGSGMFFVKITSGSQNQTYKVIIANNK